MKLTGRKKIGLVATLGAMLMVAAVVGFAQGGPQEGPPPGGPRGERGFGPRGGGPGGPIPFLRDLNLTDAQKAQVKQIVDNFEASTKELHEKMRNLRGGEMDVLKDGSFDEAAVRSAAQARAQVDVELEVARARMLSQVYAVLTPEQKAKLAERRQQFEQRRQQRDSERGAKPED
ncbi:MAG TPA: Spy/CpxP family protein refolding chaperone, partial [Pyrinomonadaceae bacterium]|nr:Spy/CpxP family protein refolding chaperone [Pyrinomonadaceae bacterium]